LTGGVFILPGVVVESAGLAAVSVGISPWVLGIVLVIVLVAGWKVFQLLIAFIRG
jgi:hypothetical protein